MINKIRSEETSVILLDCGGFFSNRFLNITGKLIANRGLQAMNLMGYTAMNVGDREFSFGADFLRDKSANLNFPLLASNLSYAKGISPFTKRSVITQAGGLKVAILGVMFPEISEQMPGSGTSGIVEIIPPDEALESLLPEIRKEADIVILLSQLGLTETKRLVDGLGGIDLAIYGGKNNKPAGCGGEAKPEPPTGKPETPVFKAGSYGSRLGYIQLSVDDAGRVAVGLKKMIFLGESVAMDDKILEITGKNIYKEVAQERKRLAEKERRKMEQDIEKLHKLTPMEYMKKVLKEQSKLE